MNTEQPKFYNGMTDGVFKAVFCNENDKELLEFLLSSILKQKVKVKRILNPELLKLNVRSKGKTLDVLTELENGNVANIEVNRGTYESLHERNAAFIFGKYSDTVKSGKLYKNMKDHIQINLTQGMPKSEPDIATYKLQCLEEADKFYIDNLVIYEYNIDSLLKKVKSSKDPYAFIAMLGAEKEEMERICGGNELMEKYQKKVEKLNDDPDFYHFLTAEEEQEKLINTLAAEVQFKAVETMLKKKYPIKEILEITGLTIEQVNWIKMKKLNDEQDSYHFLTAEEEQEKLINTLNEEAVEKNKIEIAKNLLKLNNLSIEEISTVTGLSVEQINKLKNKKS